MQDVSHVRVIHAEDSKAQCRQDYVPQIDAAERAWKEGAIPTSHASRFAANPVLEVASQPASERPTSALMNSLLVVMLALPGLAMFYGGLSRAGSVNSALMSSALSMSVVSVAWFAGAYSGSFSTTGMSDGIMNARSFFGSLDKGLLSGITSGTTFRGLPELTWFLFQLKLAIIASTIAMGGLIERAKLSAKIVMTALWVPVVYAPVCHAVAAGPGALLGDIGVLDFAGAHLCVTCELSHYLCALFNNGSFRCAPLHVVYAKEFHTDYLYLSRSRSE